MCKIEGGVTWRPGAWFEGWSNYDLALFRWLFEAAAELENACGEPERAAQWQAILAELPELARDPDGGLALGPGVPLTDSHRHFSHAMALHPLGRLKPLLDIPRHPLRLLHFPDTGLESLAQ